MCKTRLGPSIALAAGLAIVFSSLASAPARGAGGETGPTAQEQAPLTLYVSPAGNDAWSGTLPAPNAARSDGPLATLHGARDRIRKLKAAFKLSRGATVLVRGGIFFLKEPLSFGPEDSGTATSTITYAAFPDEAPVFSGGVPLKGWQVSENGRWRIHLPEVQRGEWSFAQLFVHGERRYRPRWPKEGYCRIAKEAPLPGKDKAPDSFQFNRGQLDPAWPDLADVEVLVFHSWTMDRMRIKAIDAGRRQVTFTAPTLANVWFFDLRAGKRFLVENVAAALERPGQWRLDRKAGVLTYLAMPGENPDTAEVIAPRLDRLLALHGDAAAGARSSTSRFAASRSPTATGPRRPRDGTAGSRNQTSGAPCRRSRPAIASSTPARSRTSARTPWISAKAASTTGSRTARSPTWAPAV